MGTETWLLDTLRPARATEDTQDPLSALPQAEGLSLQGTLGVGGSAVVRTGHQRSLDREVAVKQPRSVRARWLLVREARIGGRLQHPNILPVHDIVVNEVGDPLILMKRIRGETWEARIGRVSLDADLGILLQVCNAVAFAHDGGLLHRDLKPDNVMIGAFGEVVLLDWGLACRTDDLDEEWIPRAAEQTSAAGTPAFMAPEQVGDPGLARKNGVALADLPPVGPPSVRTDVFLLGALLYRILAGRPPHVAGTDVNTVLQTAWRCEIAPPPGPQGLADVAMRAMERDPEHRFPTAAAFRDAVQAHVARQAAVGAAELALGRDDPAGARAALADIQAPSALVERVEALEAEHRARKERRDFMDTEADQVVRRRLIGVMGALFGLVPLPGYFLPELVSWTFGQVSTGAFLVLGIVGVVAFRERFLATQANQVVAGAVIVAPLMQVVLDAGAWAMGVDVYQAHATHMLLWAAILAMVGVVLHRGLFVASAACLVGFLVASLHLPLTYLCLSAACFVMAGTVFVVWGR